MGDDISPKSSGIWAARTLGGVVFVQVDGTDADSLASGPLVIIADAGTGCRAARLIGPANDPDAMDADWRVTMLLGIDPAGDPLPTLVDEPPQHAPDGHDWGVLGLPDGIDTRVVPLGSRTPQSDATIARASAGHRLGEETWWLSVAAGDRVRVDGAESTLMTVDRRKRTADVERDGAIVTVALDDVTVEEASK